MDVVLIGAGGHGRVVLDILRTAGVHQPIGFLDADPQLTGQIVDGLPVLGQVNLLTKLRAEKISGAIVSIGDNHARRSYARKLAERGFELINAVHPNSQISTTARIGRNVVIASGAIVGTAACVADHVIVNTAAIIDHECEVAEAAHLCPGSILAGRVRIGPAAFIGLGAKIIQCLKIGENATVGAGAVVLTDVPDGQTVVGVPAKILSKHSVTLQPIGV